MDRVHYESLIIQDLLNMNQKGELDLSPWYQRRSVWSAPQKSYLINTIHEQKPIPAIYIRHSIDVDKAKSIREIVDGQQRSRAILEYQADEFSARHPDHKNKVLFSDMTAQQRQRFLLTALPVAYLLGATDADVIDIFGRINSVSKTLNSQEKRNALFSGEMKQFTLAQASERVNFWRNYGVFTANQIARMDEVQLVSDLTFNFINGLSDFSQTKLTKLYGEYDQEFPDRTSIAARFDKVFDFLVSLDPTTIQDTVFSRPPLLFSLFVVLDSIDRLASKQQAVEEALIEIDARFNDPDNHDKADQDFVEASRSTTQRIKQRKVRDRYLRTFIS